MSDDDMALGEPVTLEEIADAAAGALTACCTRTQRAETVYSALLRAIRCKENEGVFLTREECEALYGLMGMMNGQNPEYVFAWDGTDTMDDPETSACVKVYCAAGVRVPSGLEAIR